MSSTPARAVGRPGYVPARVNLMEFSHLTDNYRGKSVLVDSSKSMLRGHGRCDGEKRLFGAGSRVAGGPLIP